MSLTRPAAGPMGLRNPTHATSKGYQQERQEMRGFERRELLRRAALALATASGRAAGQKDVDCKVEASFSHDAQVPSQIPVLPGLHVGRSFYPQDEDDTPAKRKQYVSIENGGYLIRSGPNAPNSALARDLGALSLTEKSLRPAAHNYVLAGDGVWYLRAGDLPRLELQHRSPQNSYATPALLPDLGISGRFRLAVTAGGSTKWLDRFGSIEARLTPGAATWNCSDEKLAVEIELAANPLISVNGFLLTARVRSKDRKPVRLTWAFGRIRESGDVVELRSGYGLVKHPQNLPLTQLFAGPVSGSCELHKGSAQLLGESDALPEPAAEGAAAPCVLCSVTLQAEPGQTVTTSLLSVWGYTGYEALGVEQALKRLEGRPFVDLAWLEEMKKGWFHHWIGRALEPEKRFLETRDRAELARQESVSFWAAQKRLKIKTPDPRFDNVVNCEAANVRLQFEYPAFIHAVGGSTKYGKINCGYYGQEAAGYHSEVESSLKFISGAQDEKGRQGYFTPAFATLRWAEEVDFYYVEQVWYHYRWTGDQNFLRVMWPSVRRSLEHALAAGDPEGDGIFTGYYEFWNNDMRSRGGQCAVQTGMALAALRSATGIARRLGDTASEKRYRELADNVHEQLHWRLWNKDVGAYCSAEWDGNMRPHPEAQEQFLPVMRGIGGPIERYLASRYLRDVLFLKPQPDVTLELINDWWPLGYSHQYVANGDTAFSFLAAAKAGDVDNYWPALKTVSESAYRGNIASLTHTQRNDGTGVSMSHLAELQGPFLQSVVEGLFGVEPDFGDNLLVLRPNFPRSWRHGEISTPDLTYTLHTEDGRISLDVKTSVARRVRCEIPVRGPVKLVEVNGRQTEPTTVSEVNCCRIVAESGPAVTHRFTIEVGTNLEVTGATDILFGQSAGFVVTGATVKRVLDPQKKVGDIQIEQRADGTSRASFVPTQSGRATVFLEVQAGNTTYLHPLDLEVRQAWSVVTKSVANFTKGGPAVSSPKVEVNSKSLVVEVQNHSRVALAGPATIAVAGKKFGDNLRIAPGATSAIRLPLAEAWQSLSPGSIPVRIQIAGRTVESAAVCWEVGKDTALPFRSRLKRVDLGPHFNSDLRTLYSRKFWWRLDYTGSGVGVDWRTPMPPKDRLGYVLMRPPMSQLTYGCLPEQREAEWTPHWEVPDLHTNFETPVGVPFLTDEKTRILALVNTEPRQQLPAAAVLRLSEPVRLEKIYLLTANLTKTLKCYYPGAEMIVHYSSGSSQTIQMVPPYTMSCMVQRMSPNAYAVPFGRLPRVSVISSDTHLAVCDLLPDPSRLVSAIELRCVASETIFGIVGMTFLLAT